MMEPIVSVENFSFKYLRSDLVLKQVNLTIEKGSFTVMIGASGAGKTTLCKAMAGIVPYYTGGDYAGDVKVLGESTKGKKVSDISMKVGLMLEDYESQLVSLTAGEEVAFSLLNHGFPAAETGEWVRKALEAVGLPGREGYQLDELSGGQRQRLALASLLAVRPEVIVLDEPVSAMDPDGAESLYRLLHSIHEKFGTTLIVVEHRVGFVLPYVQNLVAIKNGMIAAQGPCEVVVPEIYRDTELRSLLPDLWQVKCELEERTGQSFALWRSAEEAVAELRSKGLGNGVRV